MISGHHKPCKLRKNYCILVSSTRWPWITSKSRLFTMLSKPAWMTQSDRQHKN